MGVPQAPPDPDRARDELLADQGLLRRMIASGLLSSTVDEKYVHWDKLRRLTAPQGFTHPQWWTAIKFARFSQYRFLPFNDRHGMPFRIAMPDSLLRQLSEADRDLSGRVPIPEQVRNPATRDGYMVSALIEEAITSSQLEGATSTRKVAAEMLRSGRRPKDKAERMIFNNFQAMQLTRKLVRKPLTPELVLDIHRRVTEGTLDDPDDAGRLRSSDDIVVVDFKDNTELHRPPKSSELESRMRTMCDFANDKTPGFYIHAIVRATLLHFWVGYDHPFTDGNGRTARALFYWSMLRSGYWLSEFLSISHILRKAPAKYSRSYLHTETDEGDTTYFVLYQLQVLHQAIKGLHAYVRRKMDEMHKMRALLKKSQAFNHRQLSLLGHALGDRYAEYTVTSHATSHDVTRQTARSDLNTLAGLNLLVPTRIGRGFVYHPPSDLQERLEQIG